MENGNIAARSGIRTPALLHIETGKGLSYGANQSWYPSWIGRMGGCGPTTTSNLLWYLTATRPAKCGGLFDGDARTRGEMLRLMRAVWRYVKPGRRGVDKASMLVDGAVRYGGDRGVRLTARVLEIPEYPADRPSPGEVLAFLSAAFSEDLPAAFLNLSNGSLPNLEKWHWVTLISVNSEFQAEMYDQSRRQLIDVGEWLLSTTAGGAFVVIEPERAGSS